MTTDAPRADAGGGIAAVIVNFRQERFLPPLLASLARQTLPPAATILVHSGPSPFAPPAGVEVVALAANRGYAAGVNAGLLRAMGLGCGAALVLNADTCLAPDCLARLAEAPGDVVQPLVLLAGAPERINAAGLMPTRLGIATCMRYRQRRGAAGERPIPIPAASGAAMLIRRSAIDRAGLFDESFFLYLEDVD